ncbi:hypothetical protein N0V82_010193 [Gnomoniopsis sp. IMI 355080]|nr:hypothetical protein N0V82_010193 [Gnomoniopsis sp. IMI 355080]
MRALATNLLFASSVAAVAESLANERNDARATTSYLARMADTWVSRGTEKDFGYTTAVLYRGFEMAIDLTQNETLVDWYEGQMSIVGDDGTIVTDSEEYNYTFYSLDEYRFGMSLLYWYNRTGEEKYKLGADKIREMLHYHPRNAEGGFWHRSPTYPDQMWGDGIFMADTFYAKYTSLFDAGNTTAWDDITLQYALIEEHCNNATSKLLKHGYDQSKEAVWADPVTGASPLVWDRADGWYFVSLTETLQTIPTSHAGYDKLVGYFKSLAEGLLNAQDSSGGWWLIMDEQYKGAEGNYIESSASAMFTYGFFVGVRLGLLDEATYLPAAKKAYEALVDKFVVESTDGLNWEGTVSVGSLNSDASYEYYVGVELAQNDFKGVGPFMWASYEYETL